MREVQMAAATTGPAFNGRRQAAGLLLEVLQRPIATVSHIDIDDNQAGDGTGHNADASLGPSTKPGVRFRLCRTSMLKVLPADQGSLVSCPNRNDRPASLNIVMDLGVHRDLLRVNPPTTPHIARLARAVARSSRTQHASRQGTNAVVTIVRFVAARASLASWRPRLTRPGRAPTLTGDTGAVASHRPPLSSPDLANE